MDTNKNTEKKKNPAENANPISHLMFLYMFPIFRKSYKTQLTEDDLFKPLPEHKSSIIGDKLEKLWKEEYRKRKSKKYILHRALIRLYGFRFMWLGLVKFCDEMILITVVPYLIRKLVAFFEQGEASPSKYDAYLYAGLYGLAILASSLTGHPCMMGIQHLSMKMRVCCSSLVYRKTLRLSKTSLGTTTVGHLVNLLSNDLNKFDQNFVIAHFAWIAPIQVLACTYILYQEIGISALIGTGFLVSFIPIQAWLGKKTSGLRLRTALRTDERVRLMNEIISGIQVIKMYCWEKPFAKLITMARGKEMKAIRLHAYIIGLLYSFEMFVSRTGIFVCILAHFLLGGSINGEKVFAITATYNLIRPAITILFSLSISSFAEINVSIKRVNEILCLEERNDYALENGYSALKPDINGVIKNGKGDSLDLFKKASNEAKVVLKDVCAKWQGESPDDTLNNINININSSQLLSVIGPVGSGKSSLLNLILKELPVKSGVMDISGDISFSSQEAWLFSGSVKDNILFGSQFNEERYAKVVEVCALTADFELLPFGDRTLVGERGKALSGGQKARISLARCVYKEADIYLLDDPLSAVDANVGKHLYDKCIRGFLRNKICILVTHQLQYLKNSDHIIIMDDGKIVGEGKYDQLQTSGINFGKLLENYNTDEHEEEKKKIKSRQNSEMEEFIEDVDDPKEGKENIGTGKISSAMYWQYFRSGGGIWMVAFLFLLFVLSQIMGNLMEYYVSYWVNVEQDYADRVAKNLTSSNETLQRDQIIYVYSAITLGNMIVGIVKAMYYMYFFARASENLHNYIFSNIIRATMRFYNANPSGRILNRFSKDLGTIDEYLPGVFIDVIEVGLLLLGAIILSASVDPYLLIPSVVFLIFLYFIRNIYVKTSRAVKRLEAVSKSPIFTHMTASVNGLTTIRAFNAESTLINEFDNFQDAHSSAWFLFLASSRCFGLSLDLMCSFFNCVAVFALIGFNSAMHAGDMGLVVTQFMGILTALQWGMRQWSELENQMTSVERILEYTKLECEPERKPKNLPVDWPQNGNVEFKNVQLKYNNDDPYVLKNVNFIVNSNEKIGIVGRTGAGKSSTISALFQLYPVEGGIVIDNVEATELPLDQVRAKISIIPQEPVLFSGTMRKNLDPFEEFNDDVLWNALEQVEMKETIAELPAGINSTVHEGGTNFSVGERQLVCLARALIRNNKILVLDEATANVDPHTDALIQNTIRTKFADCSVLTIAHRLHTVMDSDKILVMSAGSVAEFDHPYVLLQNENGILYKMVETTGTSSARNLKKIAEENYHKMKTE